VDSKQVPMDFVGRDFDKQLLIDLPARADPCGENGEFHSFVYAGPMFRNELQVKSGEIVLRDQFAYADLLPVE
jgi:diphthamide synthase (EF-2-diphthine--ammonia ligase)